MTEKYSNYGNDNKGYEYQGYLFDFREQSVYLLLIFEIE